MAPDPDLGVTGGCVPIRECWQLNPGPLEKQPIPLTTELALHPQVIKKKKERDYGNFCYTICVYLD